MVGSGTEIRSRRGETKDRRRSRLQRSLLTAAVAITLGTGSIATTEFGFQLSHDWPMLGGSSDRRMVSAIEDLPVEWDVGSGSNIRWVATLGSQTYASPVISGGKVFIGTNNDNPRDPDHKGDMGVLMVFQESDGEFLWQALSPKLATGEAQDWPGVGICSTPLVFEDRLYYINNRNELVALDTEGFLDEENDGPYRDKEVNAGRADYVWILNLISELGVYPHNASNSSPALLGDTLFVGTSNGRSEDHSTVPAPDAPSLLAVNRRSGKVIWADGSPGDRILNGQWTSPTVATIGGVDQVIIGQGDGWVRSFEAHTGEKLWEFDSNPEDAVYPETRNSILATPGVWNNLVYVANGQDPENGEGEGHLYCIDATQRGDITESGLVWQYSDIRRSISSPVIHEGLVYYPDFSGFLHCLDALSGKPYWVHDTFAGVWGSPVIADGKLYLGDADGDVVVLQPGKEKKVLAENNLSTSIYSMPSPANRALFIATRDRLFALALPRP